eukprot:2684253-Prymnesium_polylepis.1
MALWRTCLALLAPRYRTPKRSRTGRPSHGEHSPPFKPAVCSMGHPSKPPCAAWATLQTRRVHPAHRCACPSASCMR